MFYLEQYADFNLSTDGMIVSFFLESRNDRTVRFFVTINSITSLTSVEFIVVLAGRVFFFIFKGVMFSSIN